MTVPAKRPSRNPTGGSVYTAKMAERALQNVAGGMTLKECAKTLGISRDTLTRWLRNKPEFRTAMDEALRVSAINLESKDLGLAKEIAEDPKMPQTRARNLGVALLHFRWAITKRDPQRFGDQRQLGGSVSIQINTNLGADDGEMRIVNGHAQQVDGGLYSVTAGAREDDGEEGEAEEW